MNDIKRLKIRYDFLKWLFKGSHLVQKKMEICFSFKKKKKRKEKKPARLKTQKGGLGKSSGQRKKEKKRKETR